MYNIQDAKLAKKYKNKNKNPKAGYYKVAKTGEKRLVKSSKGAKDSMYIDFNPKDCDIRIIMENVVWTK